MTSVLLHLKSRASLHSGPGAEIEANSGGLILASNSGRTEVEERPCLLLRLNEDRSALG
jgi:hypothetical protein